MDSPASGILFSLVATAIGVSGAVFGVSSKIGAPRKIVPFSGGLLAGIAAFGVLPELAERHNGLVGLGMLAVGVAVLWAFSRWVYPICPSCSHTHDHDHCDASLHGFAAPLVAAAAMHAMLDGIGLSASSEEHAGALGTAVLIGVGIHKIPEGIALGMMLRSAVKSPWSAFGLCAAAEGATVLGALFETAIGSRGGVGWQTYALTLAGGSFLYLGFHAVHGEWRKRGTPALVPALIGIVCAAAIQQGAHRLIH